MNVRLNRIIHFFGEKTTNFLRGRQNQGGDAQGKRFFSVRWLLDVWGFVWFAGNVFGFEKELTGSGRSELYTDLIKLIVKISDYIFQDEEKIQKGIGDAMGGKVLELESERLRAEGEARGKAIGESIGEARGKAIGESIGKAIGEVRGEERLSVLINKLILDKRNDEIQIVVTDAKKRRQYYDEYGL